MTSVITRCCTGHYISSKLRIASCNFNMNVYPNCLRMISQSTEDYFSKNKRLNRPLSPHLTIYKPQITSMLSITHRGTGFVLSSAVTGFSIGMLLLPQSFPHYLEVIESMHFGSSLIFLTKFCISFPFLFHVTNGIRHLTWDLGYGLSLRTLYQTGYAVLGTSLALALIVSSL